MAGKTGRGVTEEDEMNAIKQISRVEGIIQLIPAEVISRRAVECGSYARALFHWEQYYRQQQQVKAETNQVFEKDDLLQHLQSIYAQIDEPDSIEGITAHLKVLNPEQQIIEDRKAGRWTAAQSWYEIALAEKPDDVDTQINLLTCLKESGQYGTFVLVCLGSSELTVSRCHSELRRWFSCVQLDTLNQHSPVCCRSRLVRRQMDTARKNPWCLIRHSRWSNNGLQRWCWKSSACAVQDR